MSSSFLRTSMVVRSSPVTYAVVGFGPSDVAETRPGLGNAGGAMAKGDPARTGVPAESGPTSRPVERWRHPLVAWGYMVIAGKVLIVTTPDGTLRALDLADGQECWRTCGPADQPFLVGANVTPVAVDGVVYVAARTRNGAGAVLLALAAVDGSERWRRLFSAGERAVFGHPAVVDGLIVTAGRDAAGAPALFAFAATDGADVWVHRPVKTPASNLHRSTVAGGTVYLGFAGEVAAVAAESGRQRWLATVGHGSRSRVVVGDVVLVGDGGRWYALDPATGAARWSLPVRRSPAMAAAANGLVYVTDPPAVEAREATSGEVRWRAELAPAGNIRDLLPAEGLLYASGDFSYPIRVPYLITIPRLVALDATSGEEHWRLEGDEPGWFGGKLAITGGALFTQATFNNPWPERDIVRVVRAYCERRRQWSGES